MDMYGASPGRFDVTGESRRVRGGQHRDDAWNYLLRGTMSVTAAAKAFGDAALVSEIHNAQPSSARLLAYRELNLTLITARKFDQRIVIGSDTIMRKWAARPFLHGRRRFGRELAMSRFLQQRAGEVIEQLTARSAVSLHDRDPSHRG
jgi:hypothetical protein